MLSDVSATCGGGVGDGRGAIAGMWPGSGYGDWGRDGGVKAGDGGRCPAAYAWAGMLSRIESKFMAMGEGVGGAEEVWDIVGEGEPDLLLDAVAGDGDGDVEIMRSAVVRSGLLFLYLYNSETASCAGL
jgi:hypothetical protein